MIHVAYKPDVTFCLLLNEILDVFLRFRSLFWLFFIFLLYELFFFLGLYIFLGFTS